jgi:hypothetical protein
MNVQQSDLIDPALVAEVDLARAAAQEEAGDERVGDYVEHHVEDSAAVTHLFEADKPGYYGWRWAVTITSAGPSTDVTVSEVVLLPGPTALVAPEWIPWQYRVQAGDLGVGDLLPSSPDDDRLVPAYLQSDDPAVEEVAAEAGLGRVRVMSRPARLDAADRWQQSEFGPRSDMARSAPAHCGTCGFYLPLGGALRAAFGTCGNEMAPADGHVVHVEYGCGAHSEAEVEQVSPVLVADLIYDDAQLDVEPLVVVDSVAEAAAAELSAAAVASEDSAASDEVAAPEASADVEPASGEVAAPAEVESASVEPVTEVAAPEVESVPASVEPASVEPVEAAAAVESAPEVAPVDAAAAPEDVAAPVEVSDAAVAPETSVDVEPVSAELVTSGPEVESASVGSVEDAAAEVPAEDGATVAPETSAEVEPVSVEPVAEVEVESASAESAEDGAATAPESSAEAEPVSGGPVAEAPAEVSEPASGEPVDAAAAPESSESSEAESVPEEPVVASPEAVAPAVIEPVITSETSGDDESTVRE